MLLGDAQCGPDPALCVKQKRDCRVLRVMGAGGTGRGTVGASTRQPTWLLAEMMMGCGRAGFAAGLLSPQAKLVFLPTPALSLLSAPRGTGSLRLRDRAPTHRRHGTPRPCWDGVGAKPGTAGAPKPRWGAAPCPAHRQHLYFFFFILELLKAGQSW